VAACWQANPALEPVAGASGPENGLAAVHRIACWNPPTPQEAAAGHPMREGFVPAAPPGGDGAAGETGGSAFFALTVDEELLDALPGARGLPEPPAPEVRR
jgi:hypothetical protein